MTSFLAELVRRVCRALFKTAMRLEGVEPGSTLWKQRLWLLENDPEKLLPKKEQK